MNPAVPLRTKTAVYHAPNRVRVANGWAKNETTGKGVSTLPRPQFLVLYDIFLDPENPFRQAHADTEQLGIKD